MANALLSLVLMKFKPTIDAVVSFPENIINLETTFRMLQAVVDDAERNQWKNKVAQTWISRLKDVAYDVDDLLDEWNTEMQREKQLEKERENADETPLFKKVREIYISATTSYVSSVVPFFTRDHIVRRVDNILKQLEWIAKAKGQFQNNAIDEFQSNLEPRLETSSFIDTAGVYGRGEDKKLILSQLLSDEGSGQVSHVPVISIVGTGGFGKTTLSQFVFNDPEVVAKFEKKMWVCVSQPFDREKVAKKIIVEATGEKVRNSDGWESLHRSLCDAVKGKLFFLVLDDVWGHKDELWRQLKLSLDGGSPGSRVLVTTRDEDVAKQMSSSHIHRLEGLSDDDCWKLFRHRALHGKDPEKFEKIGKEISKKCKGFPLAARVLSSLMSLKVCEQDWRDVLDSSIWDVTEEDGNGVQLRPELLLSYYALPPPMKQCFVYCAMFPEDMTLEKDYVVKLWMAEGFIADDGTNSLEKIGASYFDGLAMRSFFQDFTMDNGSLVGCKMHDLVRDFALFLMHGSEKSEKEPMRYFHSSREKKEPSRKQLQRLRTLIIPSVPSLKESVCLRVLHLENSIEFSQELGHLLHLRYLGLNWLDISELPESVCDLLNLQTLNLDYCTRLKSLPKRLGELSNLRHLELEETYELENFPESIGVLGHLRTLSKFIVGAESDSLKIVGLKRLSHLQGSLEIAGLEKIANVNEVFEAKLKEKKNVRSLTFDFDIKSLIRSEHQYEDEAMIDEDEDHGSDDEMRDDDEDHGGDDEEAMENEDEDHGSDDEMRDDDEDHGGDDEEAMENEDEDHGRDDNEDRHIKKMEIILKGLEPPEGLKELTIRSYLGREFPFWIKLLSNLVKLQFIGCSKCVSLPSLGNLAFLKDVTLSGFSSVVRLGMEFYGVNTESNNKDLFPRLNKLLISGMTNLIEWEFPSLDNKKIMPRLSRLSIINCLKLSVLPYQAHDDAFPALSELYINGCSSRLLIGAGKLKLLKNLEVEEIYGFHYLDEALSEISEETKLEKLKFKNMKMWVECLDEALSEISEETKLEKLKFKNMKMWVEWSLPIGNDVFSNLVELHILSCQSLRTLPALGRLKNLESLCLHYLCSVTCVGLEFLGMSDSNDKRITSFPKLKHLEFVNMPKWEEWEVPFHDKKTEFFPKLTRLEIRHCKLQALPALGKLNSLEDLTLFRLEGIKHLGTEFLGISSNGDGTQDVIPTTLFPKLTRLFIWGMNNWDMEEEIMETDNPDLLVMPCLEKLTLSLCDMLKVIPRYMFSSSLKTLQMIDCPGLSGTQPCLPSRLQELVLEGDLGEFSTSLPVNNIYHKLTDVKIHRSKYRVLPRGFDEFTAIKKLEISRCDHLDFLPEHFRSLNNLQELLINECSLLSESCIKGENWSTTALTPSIWIDGQPVTLSYAW